MAESIVKLIVDATQGIRSLGRFKKATDEAAKKTDLLKKAVRLQKAATEAATTKLAQFGDVAKSAFDRASKAAQKYQSTLGGLKGAIVSLGVAALTKRMIGQAASFQQTQIRLKALSEEYGEFGKIQQLVKDNAKTFNLSQAEAASQFSDVYARLRPLGKTLEEVQTVYKGFNATAIASGTSAAAASGAFLQLSQALGSGRLQGDEFRSIAEQVPGILKLVSDEMGVTVGELKKLGSEGEITSDILINALAKGFEKNKDKIQQILAESPAAKFKEFSNATSELSNSIGTELLPVVTPTVQALTEMVQVVGRLPGPMRTLSAAAFGLGAAFVTASGAASALGLKLTALIAIAGKVAFVLAPIVGVALAIEDARLRKEEFDKALESASPAVLEDALDKATKELDQLNAASKTFEDSPYYRGKIQDVKDLEDRLEEARFKVEELTKRRSLVIDLVVKTRSIAEDVRRQTATGRPGGAGFDTLTPEELDEALGRGKPKGKPRRTGSTAKAPQDISKEMQALLLKEQELRFSNDELAQSKIKKEIEVQRILESQLQPREKNIALIKAQNDELFRTSSIFSENFKKAAEVDDQIKKTAINAVKAAISQAAEIDEQIEAQGEKMKTLYASIGQTISTSIVDSLTAAVDGTKRLSDVASDTLRSLASILLKFGLNSLLGGLAGNDGVGVFSKLFGGGMAKGGTVMGGTSYMVGERGPELFTPGRSGSISPNSSMGGGANVVVNVDASGTKAEGDGRQANQLGAALGAAVQAELIKQKRPGGLLAA
jgi:tape measure domain-containing protein